ncbi:hypothetical protein [Hymenobacter koreensis]
MAEQPANRADQQEDAEAMTRPGSQSSSGMSTRTDDALLEAMQREQKRTGQALNAPDATGEASPDAAHTPINRNPEATTGPVID